MNVLTVWTALMSLYDFKPIKQPYDLSKTKTKKKIKKERKKKGKGKGDSVKF